MAAGDDDEQPEQPFMRFAREILQVRICRGDMRNLEQAEEVQGPQRGDRIEPPTRQRHGEKQRVKQGMPCACAERLPVRCRSGFLRASIERAPGQAQHGERKHGYADRLVQVVVPKAAWPLRQLDHVQAEHALHDDQQYDQPVEVFCQAAPMVRIALQRHVRVPWCCRGMRRSRLAPLFAHPRRECPRPRCGC